jgi:hypothetical protein
MRFPSAAPGPVTQLHETTDELAVTDDDKAEFNLLKHKISDPDVAAYVKHRKDFFGSRSAYFAFALDSDKELNEAKGLRRLIELSGQAQTIFYRWVRKAYFDAGVSDVPALIKLGKSQKLQDELAKVKAAYAHPISAGGFNPRPKKNAQYRYRLGTISEHALGNAVDIEDKHNPIISKSDWDFIQTLAGKKIDLSLKRWKNNPEALWNDVRDLNDLFVQKLAAESAKAAQEQQKTPPAQAAKAASNKEPIDVVLAHHPKLKPWRNGFLSLEWSLVNLLHEHGFRWGATFYPGSVDLHHFELT